MRCPLLLLYGSLLLPGLLQAGPIEVLSAGPDGLVVEWNLPPFQLVERDLEGARFDDLVVEGATRLDQAGAPALPFWAEVLAVPPGAQVEVEILASDSHTRQRVHFVPAPTPLPGEEGLVSHRTDPVAYGQDRLSPTNPVAVEYLGILRGVPAWSLRLYPFAYNPARRLLQVHQHLRLQIRFRGGRAKIGSQIDDPYGRVLHRAFINAQQATGRARPAAKAAVETWYDADWPWVKIWVAEDGFFRLDPDWLSSLLVDVESIDPRTFRLFHRGGEQALYVGGEEDGRFDSGDQLLFYGRYRRSLFPEGGEKDFASIWGGRNTYWLTWDGEPGRRLEGRSGAPVEDYPAQRSYWTTSHFERDLSFDELGEIDLPEGTVFTEELAYDHWFWGNFLQSTRANVPAARIVVGDIDRLDQVTAYSPRLRLSIHGATNLGHHTVVSLNNEIVDDSIWEGQREMRLSSEIPLDRLRNGRNRLLLQAFADQAKWDRIYFNWFALDYRRLYWARQGHLAFGQPVSQGHRIVVSGFGHPTIELWDLERGLRFEGMQVDDIAGRFDLTFADRAPEGGRYAAADSLAFKTPQGIRHSPAGLRDPGRSAAYLVISHRRLLAAARRLADHRAAGGLETAVVNLEDVYDEFGDGLAGSQAIGDFIAYAYHNWAGRPAYVVLLGDTDFDARDILSRAAPVSVPTSYYHERERGYAPSDFFYTLVDGDDLLPDVAIGRLTAGNAAEAGQMVDKIIGYDLNPEVGPWRSRVLYLANHHAQDIFTGPSDELASRYTEGLGLEAVKVYNPDNSGIPNPTGKAFVDALNEGALLVNFSGHGSLGTMQFVFSIQDVDWDYLSQVGNGARLPLVLAFSCLNGLFVNPAFPSLAEVFTRRPDGGAIAYISAAAKSFVQQNNLLGDRLFNQFFKEDNLGFGPVLNAAKTQLLAAHPGWPTAVRTMQLIGDPAQRLALPAGPDYTVADVQFDTEQVFDQATVQLQVTLENQARLSADSVAVAVLGFGAESEPDTLFYGVQAPFAGSRRLAFDWPVRDRGGAYRLELMVDPEDRVAEMDEGNNRRLLELDILEPLRATPVFPAAQAVVRPVDLVLEAAVPVGVEGLSCQFVLSSDTTFTGETSLLSPVLSVADGLASYRPSGLGQEGVLFWRARVRTGAGAGPWSPMRSLFLEEGEEAPVWSQRGRQLLAGRPPGVEQDRDGDVGLSSVPLPARPSEATREDGFTVRGLEGAGVLCTDGTYIYAKRWFNDASTIYPGTDVFTRIGTGFNGSRRDRNYGTVGDSTTAGIAATYHSDGFIYNDSGRAFELERLDPVSGRLDTVAVAAGLLEWQSGLVQEGHSLFTSDGRYIYNVAMSQDGQTRTAWRVRVFEPQADWAVVREFSSPPTANGFTFKWTDGVIADGKRLYFIEYGNERRVRMVDAMDGRFLDEWVSDQGLTRVITGQYDWVNNKIWLGDLFGSGIFRYSGLGQIDSGRVLSEPIGPAAQWQSLSWRGAVDQGGQLQVRVLVQDEVDGPWNVHPDWADVKAGGKIDLSRLDAARYRRIRLQADFGGTPGAARLSSWAVDYQPLPSLQMTAAVAVPDSGGLQVHLQVRNLAARAVSGARVQLTSRGVVAVDYPLADMGRGTTRTVVLDSVQLPPVGGRLFARVLATQPDAEPGDNRLEIPLLLVGRIPLVVSAWPDGGAFLDGDPLRPDQGLLIHAPPLPSGRLSLRIDGQPVGIDSLLAPSDEVAGIRALYWPELELGAHELEIQLLEGEEEIGRRDLRFELQDVLTVGQPLVYPHPVTDSGAFTYVLSHPASVVVEIYSISGWLVRRLEGGGQGAGFGQVDWDGRDQQGRLVANGTYLYRLLASSGQQRVEIRRPLSLMR
ncbi:MAG: hypothetical protein GKR89_10710 [Candidatus Latescibacteria bacterium]|nr:hypothetical protein [Candidatus Latescibacterota bacterium]